ncbi:sugar kinase [Bacillaceae bacterium Marseille-Q3522]|nr:sugar kinase [Bacillaceae bacterium Marseille-Q3522]
MKKVVTMGEIMLRLSAPNYQKFEQVRSFDVVYGGAEANVAISLARFGLPSWFVSKLPNNAIGASAMQHLNHYGVKTDHILFGGDRLGIYFLEKGFSLRPSKVIYDREHSSFAISKVEEYDFDTIFEDAEWFHISGITPALNEELFLISKKALKTAKKKGLTTSCDLNYRSSLWPFEVARKKMTELIPYVDVCIGVEPLELFGNNGKDIKDSLPKQPRMNDYQEIIEEMHRKFHFKYVAMTLRENVSVNRNRLQGLLSNGKNFYNTSKLEVEFVDRVGAGDAFSAGIIYSLISGFKEQNAIEFATGCFAIKHTIEGDANLLQTSDVEDFLDQKSLFTINR